MHVKVKTGPLEKEITEALIVGLFEQEGLALQAIVQLDQALGGMIEDLIESGDFSGKADQSSLLYPRGAIPARRILVIGLGKKEKFNPDQIRQALGKAGRQLQKKGVKQASALVPGLDVSGLPGEIHPSDIAQAATEGAILGTYQFREFKTTDQEEFKAMEELTLLEPKPERRQEIEEGIRVGEVIAHAANEARNQINGPGNIVTPRSLAEKAEKLAQQWNLKCQILDEPTIKELGMGGLLGVSQGSRQPPRLIVLEHNQATEGTAPIVLIGKGLTFDSGGISLKPSQNMEEMKYDMSGAAAVLGTLQATAALELPLYVVGLIPSAENLPSGTALKPGDVIRSLSGKTIEVINTDAEGRLVLADALAYAKRYNPAAVIDLATLTGACVIALGHLASGLLGNNPELIDRIKQAAEQTGERVWELPLWEEYAEQIKSDVADVKNVGGRPAGTITGAAFLSKFAEGLKWAHLDIAGTAWTDKEKPYHPKGGTGVGVRLLMQLLRNWAI